MARKKTAKPPAAPPPNPAAAVSELAALVQGVSGSRDGLPVLGDFLEEKFGLSATAALFRQRDLKAVPDRPDTRSFAFFPLTEDVFLWLAQARVATRGKKPESRPCTIVGLYAHPREDRSRWARLAAMLPGKDDPEAAKRTPTRPQALPDPRVEAAQKELAGHARAAGKP
jgi:hypothetical protein